LLTTVAIIADDMGAMVCTALYLSLILLTKHNHAVTQPLITIHIRNLLNCEGATGHTILELSLLRAHLCIYNELLFPNMAEPPIPPKVARILSPKS
jgi:hypothetical protein